MRYWVRTFLTPLIPAVIVAWVAHIREIEPRAIASPIIGGVVWTLVMLTRVGSFLQYVRYARGGTTLRREYRVVISADAMVILRPVVLGGTGVLRMGCSAPSYFEVLNPSLPSVSAEYDRRNPKLPLSELWFEFPPGCELAVRVRLPWQTPAEHRSFRLTTSRGSTPLEARIVIEALIRGDVKLPDQADVQEWVRGFPIMPVTPTSAPMAEMGTGERPSH